MVHVVLLSMFALCVAFFVRVIGKRNASNVDHRLEEIPGPKPLPIGFIGNILQLLPLHKTRQNFFRLFKAYPECFKLVAFNQQFVVLNNARLVQTVLKSTEPGHLSKSFMYDVMKPFMRTGLIVANERLWKPHRKMLNPSMSYAVLRGYMPMLNYHSKKLVVNLESIFMNGEPHQINASLNCTFLEIVCELLTGSRSGVKEEDVIEYHHKFQKWKAIAIKRITRPWLLFNLIWRAHPLSKEYDETVECLHSFGRQLLTKYRELTSGQPRSSTNDTWNNNNDDETRKKSETTSSMLTMLIDGGVSEDQLLEEINSMLLAGHETVATTMHFFCFIMALNPLIQESCQKEIDEVFNDPMLHQEGNLTFEALTNLKYVERCILETLRLFPPVFAYIRQLDSVLTIELKDKHVKLTPGTNVVVVPSALQMNPNYFPNPKEFDPNRFLPENCVQRPRGAFIPFSSGPRGCLGSKFAMIELKTLAAFILHRFELRTTDSISSVLLVPYITLTPKRDYWFTCRRRQPSRLP